ncbi:MAG: heparan-alpha-glucosaminide N-acetyltransferase [Pseudomonadota bacterium]
MSIETKSRLNGRLALLDLCRGIALLAMTVFHFAFDLELFGIKEPGYASQFHWKYFARSIASSFLFLTGFSLYLSYLSGLTWPKWGKRFAQIVLAALLITVATYFATPDQFIFFGILHMIAFASLFGLLFLRLPWWLIAAIGMTVFYIGQSFETVVLDNAIWWWSGLQQAIPVSSDYVPVFPWGSAPLLGIAAAKLAHQSGWIEKAGQYRFDGKSGKLIQFIGRHSLTYYLLHQPVMIGLIYVVLFITGNI